MTADSLSQLTGSKTFNLKELFENNYFIIPDYQRGYSWEDEQLIDLAKDIENIAKQDNKHYTGTIVASKHASLVNSYEVVDGQQRLTTFVILLNELYYNDPLAFGEIKEMFVSRGPLGNEKPVFTPNSETKACFEAVLEKRQFLPSIKSHEAILNAADFFQKWLKQDGIDPLTIYNTLVNKISFLFFTPEFDKEIGIMFEVINNRGKKLSELEKIKNFFIYYATIFEKDKLRDDINVNWVNIQINLSKANRTSNDDENAFLRNCYLVFFKASKDKSWNVYDECKIEFNVSNIDAYFVDNAVKKMRNFVLFVADAALHYAWFYNEGHFSDTYHGDGKSEINKILTYLRCQPTNASIMPLYLAIIARLDRADQVIRLLKLLEVVNMRLYVIPGIFSRADSKQADLFFFAYEFYNDPNWHSDDDPATTYYNEIPIYGDIFEWLYHNLAQITYAYCYSEKLIEGLTLKNGDLFNFYRWTGIRYFLACYEEDIRGDRAKRSFDIQRILSGKKAVGENLNDQLSLEHIWASKNLVEEFPEGYYTKRRLGNFVLCGLSSNISLSNNYITEKIDLLVDNNSAGQGALDMLQVAELRKLSNTIIAALGDRRRTKNYWRDLADNLCDKREDDFKQFALKRWALPNEKLLKK